jgi:RNA polymerase sigma factor (sigma-70 family)
MSVCVPRGRLGTRSARLRARRRAEARERPPIHSDAEMPDDAAELVDRCLQGDAAAWRAFVDRHTRLVWSVIRRHRLDDADAEDVHQAVFAAAVSNLGSLRDSERLVAWLATTTRRECWKTLRRQARMRPSELSESLVSSGEAPVPGLESIEQRQIVRESLVELGGRCQRLLEALFSVPGEPSYPEIAARLDMPIGSIGPTRARCLGRLAEILRRRGIREEASGSSCEPKAGDAGDPTKRAMR